MDIREQIALLREPGWVGKQFQNKQADTMEAMLEVVEAATGVHNVADKDCYWGDQGRAMIALDAALDKLKALQTNDD